MTPRAKRRLEKARDDQNEEWLRIIAEGNTV